LSWKVLVQTAKTALWIVIMLQRMFKIAHRVDYYFLSTQVVNQL